MAKLEWDRPKLEQGNFRAPRYDAEELLGIMVVITPHPS